MVTCSEIYTERLVLRCRSLTDDPLEYVVVIEILHFRFFFLNFRREHVFQRKMETNIRERTMKIKNEPSPEVRIFVLTLTSQSSPDEYKFGFFE